MRRILEDIEHGEVDPEDLARLNNFTMTMCWMLGKVSPGTLDASIKEVELAAWLQGDVTDWDIVMGEVHAGE